MMDITCDACSKKYRIDETRMKSETARVRCKACGHMLHVAKPGWFRWPKPFSTLPHGRKHPRPSLTPTCRGGGRPGRGRADARADCV